ncbi:MAG: hypothetical protein KJ737_00485 [Proteobacteria bacterium]|nr:hypothetical protein [Pseudomonadota bacterium]
MGKTINSAGFTVECKIELNRNARGTVPSEEPVKGRIPRITKLMALAIHFDQLIEKGYLQDYSEIAKLGYVSRARLTQIMNLNLLAPDIQEEILFLPEVKKGPDPITERQIRKIASLPKWSIQRKLLYKWKKLNTQLY